jgi:ribosomal protein S8E
VKLKEFCNSLILLQLQKREIQERAMTDIKEISPDAALTGVERKKTTPAKEVDGGIRRPEDDILKKDQDVLQLDEKRRADAVLEENAKLLLKELPEVRKERVEEVKRKMQEGFYDRLEVLQKTAVKIEEEIESEKSRNAEKALEPVREKLSRGFYEQPEVLKETAANIEKKVL